MRTWHKSLPMKKLHEELGLYSGVWSTQMDRYWESSDGYTVSSRQIRTSIGTVEHLAIERIGGGYIPWTVKQEIKDELFGSRAVAVEVYPAKRTSWMWPTSITSGCCRRTISFRLEFIPPVIPREHQCNEGMTSIWMMYWPGTTAQRGKRYMTPNRTMTSSFLGEVFIFDMIFGSTRFLPQHRL